MMIFLALALLILVAGSVIIARAISNAPVARETEQGLEIIRVAQPARPNAVRNGEPEDAKLHGTNPQFS